ncbi:MAG: sigma-70 family RNA polymerase sigma factor [Pirellulaceae bacterium]
MKHGVRMLVPLVDSANDFERIEKAKSYLKLRSNGVVVPDSDLEAWTRFYRRCDRMIAKILSGFKIQSSCLEDVVQTVWMVITRDLNTFECDSARGTFCGWLYVRVRSVAVDWIRRQERLPEHTAGIWFGRLEYLAYGPAESLESQSNYDVLERILRQVELVTNEIDFKLFVMRYLYGTPVHELSADSGLRQSTVRSKLYRTQQLFWPLVNRHASGASVSPRD